ncbi:hypothetical protein HH303_15555 [Rhodospirillaceae bacterium KN72]|uniref:Uncharacterized protein n=1 Tax=Pacificispira spongiicola TaxID=2729598 RepID=A0A7Y0E297_9PROT|nr:hypothetical protein [Pacificispira spongiicola]NMM45913.1 hypothetical protein [Pacificispira spongiicola]
MNTNTERRTNEYPCASLYINLTLTDPASPVYGCPPLQTITDRVFSAKTKKATDHGKNEAHGDGGRTAQKTQKQIEALQQKQSSAKTRREKRELRNRIQKINKNSNRRKKGENHSRGRKR